MITGDPDEETLRAARRDRDDETIVSSRRGMEETVRSARHGLQDDTAAGRGAAVRRMTPKPEDPPGPPAPEGGRARVPRPAEVSVYPVRPVPNAAAAADRPPPAPAARRGRVRPRGHAAPGAVVGILVATSLVVSAAVLALIVLIAG